MSYMVKLDTKLLAVSDLENYDTNGCTDFTDFIDLYGFFLEQMLGFRQKIKKIRTNR
jgi:hypothetical protein